MQERRAVSCLHRRGAHDMCRPRPRHACFDPDAEECRTAVPYLWAAPLPRHGLQGTGTRRGMAPGADQSTRTSHRQARGGCEVTLSGPATIWELRENWERKVAHSRREFT